MNPPHPEDCVWLPLVAWLLHWVLLACPQSALGLPWPRPAAPSLQGPPLSHLRLALGEAKWPSARGSATNSCGTFGKEAGVGVEYRERERGRGPLLASYCPHD